MDINALKYSIENREHATKMMDVLRERIVIPADGIKGRRFYDNEYTLWTLETQAKEEEFTQDPVFYVCQALIESAKSDYWYTREKQWTDDEDYDNEDMEVEE